MDKRKHIIEEGFRTLIVVACSIIYALAVLWFLEPLHLVGTGLTGLSQLISRLFALGSIDIPIGVFTLVLNIPLFIIGWRTVSHKFIIYTAFSVAIQSIMFLGWVPVVNFGLSPTNNMILFTIIGGLAAGVGIGFAMRFGTSTGGMDILAQAIAFKKNISIGLFCGFYNIILAILAGGIIEANWEITFYTFIYIIIDNIVVDKIHTAYNFCRIDVITNYPEKVSDALLKGVQRGCTIMDVKGGYTGENKYNVFMVVSSYELVKAKKIIRSTDPDSWVLVSPIKRVIGKFFKHPIV